MKRGWLRLACFGVLAAAWACNGIRAAPILDDDLDAGDAATGDAPSDVAPGTCANATAPASCGHDPNLPLRDAGPDADAGDLDADLDADAADASPPPSSPLGDSCVLKARYLQCPHGGNATVVCPSDDGTCQGATGACTDICCADEYVAECSGDVVPPSECRALPSDPGGFSQAYCCKCR